MNAQEENSSYMVNTIPPLSDKRTNLGRAPDQKAKMLSSFIIRAAQLNVFLYSPLAVIDCMLLTVRHRSILKPMRILTVS